MDTQKIKSISELASYVSSLFELRKRDNDTEFYTIKDNYQDSFYKGQLEWVKDMVFKAHNDLLPNDYIYSFIVEALDVIAECETLKQAEEAPFEGYLEPDVYNGRLLAWVSDNLHFAWYVDNAMQEMDCKDLFTALAYGQAECKKEVYFTVLEHLKDKLEEILEND